MYPKVEAGFFKSTVVSRASHVTIRYTSFLTAEAVADTFVTRGRMALEDAAIDRIQSVTIRETRHIILTPNDLK